MAPAPSPIPSVLIMSRRLIIFELSELMFFRPGSTGSRMRRRRGAQPPALAREFLLVPRCEPASDEPQQLVRGDPHRHECQHEREQGCGGDVEPRGVDEPADSHDHEQLGDHHATDRLDEPDACSRDQVGVQRRQHDPPEALQLARVERTADVDPSRIDASRALEPGQDDVEDRRGEHDRDAKPEPGADDDDEQRHERGDRGHHQHVDPRAQHRVDESRASHRDPHRHADRQGERVADQHLAKRPGQRDRHLAVDDEVDELGQHERGPGKQRLADAAPERLPHEQRRRDACRAQDPSIA